jgi:DDE family transposase
MTDNHGYVLAPLPVAPINETDMVLLPKGLHALKQVAKEVGLDLRGAYVNLDGGFDSRANRKCIFNAGMIPNIKENPRNRKRAKRGRKRLFNAAIHALRMRVERTFAWEDKFSATRQDWSKGIGGGDAFMKLCSSSSGCKTRPAKGEPA